MKNALNKLKLLVLTGLAAAFSAAVTLKEGVGLAVTNLLTGPATPQFGLRRQGGFILVGSRPIMGYQPGTVVELSASTEAALVAAGQATVSAGPTTTGAVSTTALQGCVNFAAAQAVLTVTNPLVTPQSIVYAMISQAAADGTFTYVSRVVCSAGQFQIYANAAATGTVMVDWAVLNPSGTLTAPY